MGERGVGVPSGSSEMYVRRRQGQRIELGLLSRRCRRRLKQSAYRKMKLVFGTRPVSSAMNNDKPMPTGAIKVALCFSAASMKMVKTS